MHGRVQGQASEHACGGVTQAIGHPRMRRFVHGQGTQQDRKPRQKWNKIDGGQQADSVPQAPRPVDSVQVGIDAPICQDGRSGRQVCGLARSVVCHHALKDLAGENAFETADDLPFGPPFSGASFDVVRCV